MESFLYSVTDSTNSLLFKLGPLSVKGWKTWLEKHPDKIYRETILSIIIHKARIWYCGLKQKIIISNLLSAANNPNTLIADLENQIATNRLTEVGNIGDYFISFPLRFAPKSNGNVAQDPSFIVSPWPLSQLPYT